MIKELVKESDAIKSDVCTASGRLNKIIARLNDQIDEINDQKIVEAMLALSKALTGLECYLDDIGDA